MHVHRTGPVHVSMSVTLQLICVFYLAKANITFHISRLEWHQKMSYAKILFNFEIGRINGCRYNVLPNLLISTDTWCDSLLLTADALTNQMDFFQLHE